MSRHSSSLVRLDNENTSLTSQLRDVSKQLEDTKTDLDERVTTLSIERQAHSGTLEAWMTEVSDIMSCKHTQYVTLLSLFV